MVTHGEGKDAPHLSAEDGTEHAASCMERQSDECWSKVENQREGHRDSGSQSQVEMGRPCGRNGPAQMGTGYINVGRKNRQKENGATADKMDGRTDTFRRAGGGQWSRKPKTGASGIDTEGIRENTSTSDKTLELCLVPPGGRCTRGIN
jgi:hypothetical protein